MIEICSVLSGSGCWRMWYTIYDNRPHRRHFTVHCLQWSITFLTEYILFLCCNRHSSSWYDHLAWERVSCQLFFFLCVIHKYIWRYRFSFAITFSLCMSRLCKLVVEPSHEIMALFVLRKDILQTRMRSHPVGLDVLFVVRPFVYFHTSCMRTVKALVRLLGCASSPKPSLVAYVISIIISWAGSFDAFILNFVLKLVKILNFHQNVQC